MDEEMWRTEIKTERASDLAGCLKLKTFGCNYHTSTVFFFHSNMISAAISRLENRKQEASQTTTEGEVHMPSEKPLSRGRPRLTLLLMHLCTHRRASVSDDD